MIILDTNVLSELLRAEPEPNVIEWFGAQASTHLFITSITQAEMLHGARLLPRGKRREALECGLNNMFEKDFASRILSFDAMAAPLYADIVVARARRGRPVSQFDAQIAAIARLHEAGLATRNTKDFVHCGIDLLDPWA